jgi:4-aminobutyrate--pyruvate transaminase
VASAVALETIRIIEEENIVAHAALVGERLRTGLKTFESHPLVGEVRGVGLIAAVELVIDKAAKKGLEMPGKLGGLANGELQAAGVISRNMGDALAFCPPLIITENEVDDLLARFGRALNATLDALPAGTVK